MRLGLAAALAAAGGGHVHALSENAAARQRPRVFRVPANARRAA